MLEVKKKTIYFILILLLSAVLVTACASSDENSIGEVEPISEIEEPSGFNNGEVEYTPIPVSPVFEMVLWIEHDISWVRIVYETDGPRGINPRYAFRAEDGSGMLFATVPLGGGIAHKSIQGYDPATETFYILYSRFEYDYNFYMHENELLVTKASTESQQLMGIFRPVLNRENHSFDLIEIDEEFFTSIQRHWQEQRGEEYRFLQSFNFITQPLDDIERIVILLDPNWGGNLRTFYLTEQSEIEYLYNLLNETTLTHVNEHPMHYESLQYDLAFRIRVEYVNGEVDEIGDFYGMPYEIYRYLDTRGSNNDPGFLVGTNERIWEFIRNIEPPAQRGRMGRSYIGSIEIDTGEIRSWLSMTDDMPLTFVYQFRDVESLHGDFARDLGLDFSSFNLDPDDFYDRYFLVTVGRSLFQMSYAIGGSPYLSDTITQTTITFQEQYNANMLRLYSTSQIPMFPPYLAGGYNTFYIRPHGTTEFIRMGHCLFELNGMFDDQ